MKKSIILLSAITMVLSMCSCQKESRFEYEAKGVSLTATFEKQADLSDTKTYIDGTLVKWSPNDAIKVFYSSGQSYEFNLEGGESTTQARFGCSEFVDGTPEYAIYPYSEDAIIDDSNITFTIPSTQNYVANSFDNGANIAVAQVSGTNMQFKNVCGVLCLKLKGSGVIHKIVLTGGNNEKLNGQFTVDASSSTPSALVETATDDSEKSITLDCSTTPVTLHAHNVTYFYFVVPVGAFSTDGFEALVYGLADERLDVELVGDETNVINRSKIRIMPEKVVNGFILPTGYKKLDYIEANGGDLTGYSNEQYAYIDTGCEFEFGDHFYFKFLKCRHIGQECIGYGNGPSNNKLILGGGRINTSKGQWSPYVLGQHLVWTPGVAIDDKMGVVMLEEWTMRLGAMDLVLTDDTTGERYTLTAENEGLKPSYSGTSTNIYFFRSNTAYPNPSNIRLYETYLQRTDGSYAFHMTPALRVSDSKPGVYDLVSGEFLINQGTGADFTYPTPAE